MHNVTMSFLLAFVSLAQAIHKVENDEGDAKNSRDKSASELSISSANWKKEEDSMDKFVDKFVDKLFGHLVVQPRMSQALLGRPLLDNQHRTPYAPTSAWASHPSHNPGQSKSSPTRKSQRLATVHATTADQAAIADPDPPAMYDEVNEAKMIAAAGFPIKPADLIERCKEVLKKGIQNSAESLADDFQFIGPVVGPLSKEPFVKALGGFDLTSGFPNMKNNYHGFFVDPFEPNRVWFFSRTMAKHAGTFAGSIKATGTEVEMPPQAQSMTFNEKGQVTKITVGVVMDRTVGNTGGLGGIFGLLYAVGSPLPFPEANPWKMSKRYKFFNFIGPFLSKLQKKPEAETQDS